MQRRHRERRNVDEIEIVGQERRVQPRGERDITAVGETQVVSAADASITSGVLTAGCSHFARFASSLEFL